MRSEDTTLLPWDTEVLQIKTAKILPINLTAEKLTEILQELKQQNIQLVYWACDGNDLASQTAAEKNHGFLADRKTTYLIKINNDIIPVSQQSNLEILSYPPNNDTDSLLPITYDIGAMSRFNQDPKIGYERMKKVYELWIKNSVNRSIAKEVLIARYNKKIAGYVTLGEKNNRGDIGLIGVDQNARGLGIGAALVNAALQWCVNQEYSHGQVVTQLDNEPACKLYEKCGYKIEKVENFYHFWL